MHLVLKGHWLEVAARPTMPIMSSTATAAADMSCTKRQQAWPRFCPSPSSESCRRHGMTWL